MYLKRIEINGFKSFADKVIINFDDPITGIVGPNGCGKSNISDAIRWVLGEQSVKSLRGEKMSDVIFQGSFKRKSLNMAEVSLVFDNESGFLKYDSDEVEITRRIYNDENDAEYLINRKRVRLKDIQNLILDTGFGKDSLSIITQGSVNSFAEAKAYDRRLIFEEAAGVLKYKKNKNESINKLARTKENLDRVEDILNELEKQVIPLKKQAEKARIYKAKKEELEAIEISYIVNEIIKLNDKKDNLDKTIFDLETNKAVIETAISVNENESEEIKEKLKELDLSINSKQDKLMDVMSKIGTLENRRVEIDQKRKYLIQNNSEDSERKLKELLNEAKLEYEDRLNRKKEADSKLKLANEKLERLTIDFTDKQIIKNELNLFINRLNTRVEVLKNIINDPLANSSYAIKSIYSNKSSLSGIVGIVGELLSANEGYGEALKAAISASTYHIVTINDNDARRAIEFLKRNKSGRATFLPLNVLKPVYINEDDLLIARNSEGFKGILSEFVKLDDKYLNLRYSLLDGTLVFDNLDNANAYAKIINHRQRIVTLDGDILNRGGSMSGGKTKNETSIFTAKDELNQTIKSLNDYKEKESINNHKINKLLEEKNNREDDIYNIRIQIAQLEPLIEVKKAKYEKILADIKALDISLDDNDDSYEDNFINKLNDLYKEKDELSNLIKNKREQKIKFDHEHNRLAQKLRTMRQDLSSFNDKQHVIIESKTRIAVQLDNHLQRLASDYKLTFEFAKEHYATNIENDLSLKVASLRADIERLGNINMEAPDEFEKISERYDFTKKSYDELIKSRNKLLNTINEMDQKMKEEFLATINAINKELPNTFARLFSGGSAKLTFEDPDDILNSGIDIDVKPPGKAVKSIRLFSGGEKTLIAISVLFTILKVKKVPLVIFDEVEAALDQANVEKLATYVRDFSKKTQFIIITHRSGTMSNCDTLYGVTMQNLGVSRLLKVKLVDAISLASKESE